MTTQIQDTTPRQVRSGATESERGMAKTPATYRPAVDIFEAENNYTIFVDLPGADRESINITSEGGALVVEASAPQRLENAGAGQWLLREFGVGDYRRIFRLGEDVDTEKINASFSNGVLTITLPKVEQAMRRKIRVQAD